MIKVTDYITKRLKEYGVSDIFMVTGGGAMHLNDSLGRDLNYVCCHHEQACGMAAEGYARFSGKLGVVNVTSGPGGTNAISAVLGQWTDSVPALYLSGQVKFETTLYSVPHIKGLRQLGDQEADIVSMVTPITKFACMLTDPYEVRYTLEKAIHLATTGRPGPVWIDIPLNVQGALIDESKLLPFVAEPGSTTETRAKLQDHVNTLIAKLKKAERPLVYVGYGVRIAKSQQTLIDFAEKNNIPIVTAISGHDLIGHDHPLFFGKPGICGDRIGNIMVQNSDVLLIVGTRLSLRQLGYNFAAFAPKSYKVMVDIDEAELNKPTLSIDLKIHADIKDFFDVLIPALGKHTLNTHTEWTEWGTEKKSMMPALHEDNPLKDEFVSSYVFAAELFSQLPSDGVVVTGNGTAYTSTYQAMHVKQGVRVIANQGCASMGYDLPAGMGACIANNRKPTVVITGDGSIQMNIQELQTIVTYKLPVKIFVLENKGYLCIRSTQTSFFNKHYVGSSPTSGVVCPDLERIATAYQLPFRRITTNQMLKQGIAEFLKFDGAGICEIVMDPAQTLFPKASSKMNPDGKMETLPLDHMFPFLSDEVQQACNFEYSTRLK